MRMNPAQPEYAGATRQGPTPGLGTRVPVPPGKQGMVREPCCRLRPLPSSLPSVPAAAFCCCSCRCPQTTGGGVWRERENEELLRRKLARHWPISAQPGGPHSRAGPMRGRAGPAGKLTHWDQVVPGPPRSQGSSLGGQSQEALGARRRGGASRGALEAKPEPPPGTARLSCL